MATQTDSSVNDACISSPALLAALLVFLIPGLLPDVLNDSLPSLFPPSYVLLFTALAIMLILFIAALLQGLPRWALPLAGIIALLLSFLFALPMGGPWWSPWLPSVMPGDEEARLLWQVINSGFMWLNFLLAAILLTWIVPSGKPLRPLMSRVRRDWTQLSFLLYGATLFSVAPAFDAYGYAVPFQIVSLLFLAAGAWGYLRTSSPGRRLLALLVGITLAMLTITIGKWLIVPLQNWTVRSTWHPPEVERRFELVRTLFELGWILLALSAPASLEFVFRRDKSLRLG